ncbi:hypothetical protein [Bdellovibrio svalbardensis]|uniref:Uncharacterized protein n=1 Tax=Bdellovibrio svalbardensis TaxID=2972972 RepID=A0ABT6DIG0_9BACT|nr:hypothetical protein [Bdellovibrio svalbardensis]MDG0816638.1 hypothetical protein [Bdellovibrio svalbardensis]
MEQEKSCGSKGYWKEFGYPYCTKFLINQNKFSPRLQRWLTDVRECLQVRVSESTQQASCSQTYRAAMDSHVSCYVDTGFCELNMAERFKIYWSLKGALRHQITWKEARLLRHACNEKLD